MTEEELRVIEARFPLAEEWTLHSGCSDYACYCHFEIPALVAEVRRLRAERDRLSDELGDYKDIRPAGLLIAEIELRFPGLKVVNRGFRERDDGRAEDHP